MSITKDNNANTKNKSVYSPLRIIRMCFGQIIHYLMSQGELNRM